MYTYYFLNGDLTLALAGRWRLLRGLGQGVGGLGGPRAGVDQDAR